MTSLSAIGVSSLAFAAPYVLLALFLLPAIWFLLRLIPPAPVRVVFPAARLLAGLREKEEAAATTPLWLKLLRLLIAALIIAAFAGPVWNPDIAATGERSLLLIVDNGWAAADRWQQRRDSIETIIDKAERSARPAAYIATAARAGSAQLVPRRADELKAELAALEPQPWQPDRLAVLTALMDKATMQAFDEIVWLSDGLDYGNGEAILAQLGELASQGIELRILTDGVQNAPIAVALPEAGTEALTLPVKRATSGVSRDLVLHARASDGRVLSTASTRFGANKLVTTATFDLPLDLRNEIERIEIANYNSAAGVVLLDERWRRQRVGLVSGETLETAQPLLSDVFYLQRALSPYAEIENAAIGTGDKPISELLSKGISVLILGDIGQIVGDERNAVDEWIKAGGLLIRFAGPRTAAQTDDLVPVTLRRGGRALGGALSWTTAQKLSPFDPTSPFRGIDLPADVAVNQQVLAEPSPDLSDHTWARLEDGTPLVTSAAHGKGRIVLFHVTANTQWSNLPLSGAFVEMLRRTIALGQGVDPQASGTEAVELTLPPQSLLDGFGNLTTATGGTTAIKMADLDRFRPGPQHPPGFYGAEGSRHALNLATPDPQLVPLPTGGSLPALEAFAASRELDLKPWLLAAAFALLLADMIATLLVSGRLTLGEVLKRPQPSRMVIAATLCGGLLAALAVASSAALADEPISDEAAIAALSETHLAYVITGDQAIDRMSLAGLGGLGQILRQRTAFEPGDPVGVNVERDELVFYPFIYWPITANEQPPSPQTLERVDAYLRSGGTILFDTRDHQVSAAEPLGATTPASAALRRLLSGLDVPPLTPVPPDHVLTRSYYLLRDFPGRWAGGDLWVEQTSRTTTVGDGVSSILIGSNDYAAAWARDDFGRPLAPVVPGGERQREMANRFGVNLVMYALTGNYKADQVHVPALLERLGQ